MRTEFKCLFEPEGANLSSKRKRRPVNERQPSIIVRGELLMIKVEATGFEPWIAFVPCRLRVLPRILGPLRSDAAIAARSSETPDALLEWSFIDRDRSIEVRRCALRESALLPERYEERSHADRWNEQHAMPGVPPLRRRPRRETRSEKSIRDSIEAHVRCRTTWSLSTQLMDLAGSRVYQSRKPRKSRRDSRTRNLTLRIF